MIKRDNRESSILDIITVTCPYCGYMFSVNTNEYSQSILSPACPRCGRSIGRTVWC